MLDFSLAYKTKNCVKPFNLTSSLIPGGQWQIDMIYTSNGNQLPSNFSQQLAATSLFASVKNTCTYIFLSIPQKNTNLDFTGEEIEKKEGF